ncbi:MAG: hypothetical protein QS748_13745 [Candidatus Endonucleobacter bathymodioli]|uniref:ABC transporter ATP-binding protein n=1 Tax=Candidatus Endonucleibacter bathymodioli TaxID=539814 RepID=A0AA90NN15_9GAMM|nr:hypothetical protein [Candidatus Endonucleobacter bathymodioli]
MARMRGMIDKSNIMILVSHNHELILSLCNRVIWLDRDQLVADGSPEEIVGRYLEVDRVSRNLF